MDYSHADLLVMLDRRTVERDEAGRKLTAAEASNADLRRKLDEANEKAAQFCACGSDAYALLNAMEHRAMDAESRLAAALGALTALQRAADHVVICWMMEQDAITFRSAMDSFVADLQREMSAVQTGAELYAALASQPAEVPDEAQRERVIGMRDEVERLRRWMFEPQTCAGEWVRGSGGHREHEGECENPVTWSFPGDMWAYCDKHIVEHDKEWYIHRPSQPAPTDKWEVERLRDGVHNLAGRVLTAAQLYAGVRNLDAGLTWRGEKPPEAARAVLSAIPSYSDGLRPEVIAFAHAMEAKLRENDHKGGWRGCSPDALFDRMRDEGSELLGKLVRMEQLPSNAEVRREVAREAADVANFAMMIADVCHGLTPVAAPSDRYAQGFADAKRRAVEAVEKARDTWHDKGREFATALAVRPLRAIEPEGKP
jgi:hypothetical protein